jgi:hypothetical protein
MTVAVADVIAGIAFDPQIRAILAVATGVVILMGSIYMLLGTNLGNRLGFLIALTGFFGWMTLLCFVWWIYAPGIGPGGRTASWHVIESNTGDLATASLDKARSIDLSTVPAPDELTDLTPEQIEELNDEHSDELADWRLLPAAERGEPQAVVDAYLADSDLGTNEGIEDTTDYVQLHALEIGGKPERSGDGVWDRIAHKVTSTLRITHPPHYALVQIQRSIEQEAEAGQPPPTPEPDESHEVVSLILERDLGERRLPQAAACGMFLLLFLLACWLLHRRDLRATELRALPAGT